MVRRTVSLLVVVVVAGLAGACAASANVEQEKTALLAADRAAAADAMDTAKAVQHFAPDATFHAGGMPALKGHAAIGEFIKASAALPGFSLKWTPVRADVGASGDLGFTIGTYAVTMNNWAGKPVTENGKYVTIWKKQSDGQWKVIEDIGNSNAPTAPMSSPHVMAAGAELKWGEQPPFMPPGGKMAVVSGDPSKAEPFTLRAQLPAGYRVPPHWHPTDEHVTVLAGTFALGMGEKFDPAALKDLPPGGYANLSATMPHFAVARNAVTIQVHGVGPFLLTYVNPADDPSKKK